MQFTCSLQKLHELCWESVEVKSSNWHEGTLKKLELVFVSLNLLIMLKVCSHSKHFTPGLDLFLFNKHQV